MPVFYFRLLSGDRIWTEVSMAKSLLFLIWDLYFERRYLYVGRIVFI